MPAPKRNVTSRRREPYLQLDAAPPLVARRASPHRPLLGCAAELAARDAHLAAARRGAGRLVRVTGEAGLGKSRLVAEVAGHAAQAGFAVYEGAAQASGAQASYLAWRPIWRALVALPTTAPPAEQVARVTARVAEIDPARGAYMPRLGRVIDLPLPLPPDLAALDDRQRKEAVSRCWRSTCGGCGGDLCAGRRLGAGRAGRRSLCRNLPRRPDPVDGGSPGRDPGSPGRPALAPAGPGRRLKADQWSGSAWARRPAGWPTGSAAIARTP